MLSSAPIGSICVIEELKTAITGHQFVLYYQPIFDLSSGLIASVEALVRWQHPQRGLLAPQFFLPQLEEHPSLMKELCKEVLRSAFYQAAKWHSCKFKVSVNVSAFTLAQSGFVEMIESLLTETKVSTKKIKLEITENISLLTQATEFSSIWKTLYGLSDLKIALSVDDFGTGFNTMLLLKQFPFSELKIDKGLTSVDEDNREYLITRSIIDLAHSLEIDVVAEGVERSKQLQILRKLTCDFAQGYLLANPCLPQKIDTLLPQSECGNRDTTRL